MDEIFYSRSTQGFYTKELHGERIPADAKQVSQETYEAMLEGQANGKLISCNEHGFPILVDPPPSLDPLAVPTEVSRFQARAALLQAGLLDDIEAYMADPATDPFVRIAWQDAQVFKRNSPTVLSLQPLLGLTDGQLDDLFRFAATIEA